MFLTKGINIRQRFIFGYTVIAVAVSITVLVSFIVFKKNKDLDELITYVQVPALLNLKDLEPKIVTSYQWAENWASSPNQHEEDERHEIVNIEIPKIVKDLNKDLKRWPSVEDQKKIIILNGQIEQFLETQRQLTKILPGNDRTTGEGASEALALLGSLKKNKEEILPAIKPLIASANQQFALLRKAKVRLYNIVNYMLVGLFVLVIFINFFAVRDTTNSIIKPLLEIKRVMFGLSKGEILTISHLERTDEIGEMNQAMQQMLEGIKAKTDFAVQIGHGQYNVAFESSSDKDTLGLALVEMRENLKNNAEEERKRVWVTAGQAQFGDVLRNVYTRSEDFYAEALKFVIKYLGANQGGLFILNENQQDPFLELAACYAYERKKFIGKKIQMGEGLVGQCFLEQEMIYLTEIPQNYVYITSGLGDATPTSLLLVPLKLNENVFGVIEIASFSLISDYQIGFVQRISELLASSISNMKVTERTKILLQDSQTLTAQLREQEEEMRQNMEELLATQEDLKRKEGKYLSILKENGLSELA